MDALLDQERPHWYLVVLWISFQARRLREPLVEPKPRYSKDDRPLLDRPRHHPLRDVRKYVARHLQSPHFDGREGHRGGSRLQRRRGGELAPDLPGLERLFER